tara:strand:- start:2784 stop:3428 length:645 start_codon:yes stop_codon:yes gene_type:complete
MIDNPQSRNINRHEFDKGRLDKIDGVNPFELAELWMSEAVSDQEVEPNAFSLNTVSVDMQPSSRIVYLKDLIDSKYVFYTNYNSSKAKDIEGNSKVSMLFFYQESSRQIRIDGVCTRVNEEISDAYFSSRPRNSQLGAWASNQSEKLDQYEILENRVKEFDQKFLSKVPRPDFWGGYQIEPTRFEFWQGRPSRLHDRLVFEVEDDEWKTYRINP